MHRSLRLLALASATALSFAASAQSQTITFSNSTPPVTVNLLTNSQVQIGTSGNLTAACQLDVNSRCVGLPSGGSGNAPTVSISASTNQTTTGSPITITATVSNAQVCERRAGSGSSGSVSGWTGLTAGTSGAAGGATTAVSPGTFNYELKCWNDGGSTTSAVVPVTITQGSGSAVPSYCSQVTPPAGYTRDSRTDFTQLFPLATATTQANTPPETGTTALTPVVIQQGRYLTVAFTTGSANFLASGGQFEWAERQSGGTSADLPHGTFVNFSSCPGDFNLRTVSLGAGDINAFASCRSHRPSPTQIIQFKDAASAQTQGECPLQPNTTYYLNMLWVDPRDGISPGEYNCQNNASECGLMFK